MEQNIIDYIIEVFGGVIVDDYGWEHYTIKGKKYDIRFDPSRIEGHVIVQHLCIVGNLRRSIVNIYLRYRNES